MRSLADRDDVVADYFEAGPAGLDDAAYAHLPQRGNDVGQLFCTRRGDHGAAEADEHGGWTRCHEIGQHFRWLPSRCRRAPPVPHDP
ncbi:MAG: hypothetical protein QOC69_7155 [Mycobacterium sp.]|nr:hypothetical protein [Mycobacterium sp.]